MPRRSPIVELFWGGVHSMLLLEMAASVSPSGEEQVRTLTPWEARNQIERLRVIRHGEDVHAAEQLTTDIAAMKGRLQLASKANMFSLVPFPGGGSSNMYDADQKGPEEERTGRILQESCVEGDPFTITSTIVPEAAGCYSDTGLTGENGAIYSETGTTYTQQNFVTAEDFGDVGAPDIRWVVGYVVSDTTTTADSVIYCYSADQATGVHPADVASWYCTTSSTGGSELVTPDEFSISCGCSTATDTTTDVGTGTTSTTTVTPVTTTTTDTGSSTCDDGESFTILSTVVSEAAGCYSDTGTTVENAAVYSETGTTDAQQNFVLAVDFGDAGVPDIRWAVGYLVSDTTTTMDSVLYCYSADQATDVHPADVASWYCTTSSTSGSELVTPDEFSISCGCSAATDTTTDVGTGTTSTTTVTPVTTTTTDTGSSTCDDGESFTILSTVVSEAAGCYSDTGTTVENAAVYSETGTTDGQQNFVLAVDFGDAGVPDIRWAVGYLVSDTTTTMDSVLYCYSADQATDVHPADVASWYCTTSSTSGSELVTPDEFSISCGCSAATDTTTDVGTGTTSTTTVTPVTTTTTDTGSSTCDDGESFTILSTVVSEAAGCYSDTGTTVENAAVYSETGTTDAQQNFVLAVDFGDAGVPDIRWTVGYLVSDTTTTMDSVLYCYSADQATDVHPTDVASWYCTTNSTGGSELVTPEEFSISCGCSAATDTTTDVGTGTTSTTTDTSVTTTTTDTGSSTCDDGESFTILSTVVSEAAGCYSDTGTTVENAAVYSETGTTDAQQNFVLAVDFGDAGVPDIRWAVGYLVSDTTTTMDSVLYCYSADQATDVHPADVASWYCTTSSTSGSELVTPDEFSISCGCSAATDTTTDVGTGTTSTTTVTPVTTTTTDTGSSTCDDGESFTILSTVVSEAAGCYSDTGTTVENAAVYSETGTTDAQQNFVLAVDFGDAGVPDIRWAVGYLVSDTTTTMDSVLYCYSADQATDVHPADVASWYCTTSSTSGSELVTPDEFSISCGCSAATDTTTDVGTGTTSTTTVTPVTTTTTDTGSSTCDDGESFTILSTVVSEAAGCYSDTGTTVENAAVYSETGTTDGQQNFVLAVDFGDAGVPDIRWAVGYLVSDTTTTMDSVLYCYSADQATDVHPADVASWYCTTSSTSGSELVTPDEFSISCGCSAATDTTTDVGTGTTSTTTVTPVTTTTTDTGSSTCDDGESFTILSTVVSEAAGCYSDTGTTVENAAVYSETGTTDAQQNFVLAVDFGDAGVPDIRWTVGYLVSDTTTTMDSVLYCYSADQATDVHPTDVASWYCTTNSTGDSELVTPEEFSISCGCSAATDTTTDVGTGTTSTTTDTPGTTTTTDTGSSTCDDGESFTILSTIVPEAAGCYSDTGVTGENGAIYSETGTTDTQQNFVMAVDFGDVGVPDIRWTVAYLISDTTTTMDSVIYCYSADQATGVHPADVASWYCTTNSTGDSELVTPEEFSISCGCSAATDTTTDVGTGTTSTTTDTPGTTTTTDTGSSTCDDGESFTILSTIVPEAAGCYSDTGVTGENGAIYSETGTTDTQQNFVMAVDFGDVGVPDIRWTVAYLISDTTTTMDSVIYCYSADQATGVHPADVASWYCYENSGTDPELASVEEFSISCGCSINPDAIVSPTPEPIAQANGDRLPVVLPTIISVAIGFMSTAALCIEW